MAAGDNKKTRKYFHLENFFFDHTFFDFIEHFLAEADAAGRRFRLVLNGDIIDFLRIDYLGGTPPRLGRITEKPTPLEKIQAAMDGHPGFMRAISRWVAAGHDLILLPGNHDPEWGLPEVREAFLSKLAQVTDREIPEPGRVQEVIAQRVEIRPWFYYEPGRIWVEHGSQYDRANSSRHPLARWDPDSKALERIWRQEEPLGSFFQRHLYSWFGNVTFVVPNARADGAYARWLTMHRPRVVGKLILRHLPFMWRVIRSYKGLDPGAFLQAQTAQKRHVQELAREADLGEKLERVDALKIAPLEHKIRVLNRVFWLAWGSIVGLLLGAAVILWVGYSAVSWAGNSQLPTWLQGLVFGGANLSLLLVLFVALAIWLLHSQGSSDSTDVLRLRTRALEIAAILNVPIVSFGHSHAEDISVASHASYFNTGTWIPVFTGEDIRLRDRVSFPFLLVTDDGVEFLRWDHLLGRAVRFPLLEADPWNLVHEKPVPSSAQALEG
jgi:UDP-2,3-diacylglucosamine pyrophosphatase LpxH